MEKTINAGDVLWSESDQVHGTNRGVHRRKVNLPTRTALSILLVLGAAPSCTDRGISISYSPTFDTACSVIRGARIKDQWKTELVSRLPEFRRLWEKTGPKMLAEAEELTGLHAPASVTARLTLCNLPSQSFLGVSVNMRFALGSFTSEPVPLRYKVDTLFHELLHRMLAGHVEAKSPLLAAHSGEPECVKNHLHLLALQKAVLLKLDESRELDDVVRVDGQLPGGCYKRAWTLVNASDSQYLAFVAEIRK